MKKSSLNFCPIFKTNFQKSLIIIKIAPFCYNKNKHILYNRKQEVGKMEPLNLLLVEDEESLASFIQSELQFEGYKTSWEKMEKPR